MSPPRTASTVSNLSTRQMILLNERILFVGLSLGPSHHRLFRPSGREHCLRARASVADSADSVANSSFAEKLPLEHKASIVTVSSQNREGKSYTRNVSGIEKLPVRQKYLHPISAESNNYAVSGPIRCMTPVLVPRPYFQTGERDIILSRGGLVGVSLSDFSRLTVTKNHGVPT